MKNKLKRILLTGSSGQVGWELHRSLAPHGEVISPNREEFDLSRPESLRKKIREWKPDLIVNPAAYTAVDKAEDESELAFIINAMAPRVIAEEAEKLKIALLHYSTDYIFDGEKTTPYREDDTPNPLNVYGESKLLGEQAIQDVIEQHLIIRTSWVYSHRGNNFLNSMLRLFLQTQEIKVVNDQIGSPSSARLIAEMTGIVLREELKNINRLTGKVYHLTTGGKTTWYDFAKEILRKSNTESDVLILPVSSTEYDTKALRPSMSLLDNSELIKSYNVTQINWKTALNLEINGKLI